MIKRKEEKEQRTICPKCGGTKGRNSNLCCKCSSHNRFLNNKRRPPKEILEKEIKENSCLSLGRKYGVSNTTIKKWAKLYGLDIRNHKTNK